MNKKILSLFLSSLIGVGIVFGTIGYTSGSSLSEVDAGYTHDDYYLELNNDKNKLMPNVHDENLTYYSGTQKVYTKRNTELDLTYTDAAPLDDAWGQFQRIEFEQYIHGIESITVDFADNVSEMFIRYGGVKSDSFVPYKMGNTIKAFFDFEDTKPNYIELSNAKSYGSVKIKSIKLKFSCSNEFYSITYKSPSEDIAQVYSTYHCFKKGWTTDATIKILKPEYRFAGWYIDGELRSTNITGKFTHDYAHDVVIEAKVEIVTKEVLTGVNIKDSGIVTGGGTYKRGSQVTIKAIPNPGYKFYQWIVETNNPNFKVSKSPEFTFVLDDYKYKFTADFLEKYFNINAKFDSNMGTVTCPTGASFKNNVTINAIANKGYDFAGWFEGENLFSKEANVSFSMPSRDLNLEARFVPGTFHLNVTPNEPHMGSTTGSGDYLFGNEVLITAIPNPGFGFVEFTDGLHGYGRTQSSKIIMPSNDLNITAIFGEIVNVDVTCNMPNACEITAPKTGVVGTRYSFSYKIGEGLYFLDKITVEVNGTISNTDTSFTLKGPAKVVIYLKTVPNPEATFTFGSYPHSAVSDTGIINSLNSMSGALPTLEDAKAWTAYDFYNHGENCNYAYYIDLNLNGEKYRGIYFLELRKSIIESDTMYEGNDNKPNLNQTYWFLYQPLRWTADKNATFAICNSIIDSQPFYQLPIGYSGPDIRINDYSKSYIRKWLNDDFIKTAFSIEDQKHLISGLVDNSLNSTYDSTNPNICEDTYDKVMIPSNRQYSYDFSIRLNDAYATPYAKYMGLSTPYGSTYWMKRSPDSGSTTCIKMVGDYDRDEFHGGDARRSSLGVIPVIRIA